jgi:HAE1 family hydrophobic/amphiphilic exporter-1
MDGSAAMILALLLQVAATMTVPAEGPARLSRAEAVARALAAHPEVRKSQANLESLEGRKQEALADALPSLDLLATGSRFRDPSLLNSPGFDEFPPEFRSALRPIPANLYDSGFQLRQTLWSFKLGAAVKAARFGLELGKEDVKRTEHDVALAAVRAYHDYVLALEKVRVTEQSIVQKEKHLEMARTRREAGVVTELDVLRSEVDLANARAVLERSRGEAEQARGQLNTVMVRPVDAPIVPTDALVRRPVDVTLEAVSAAAVANRSELKVADLNVRVYEQLVGVERGERRPRLDFVGGYGRAVRDPGNVFKSDFSRWSGAISLTVPLFDGFRSAGRIAQAQASVTRAEQDRILAESRIRLEAKQAVDRLRTAERVLDAAELTVSQAARALEMTQANYRYGAATTIDVLDAQAALTLAESLRVQGLYDHANARAGLRYVMGQSPLEEDAAR